MSAFLLGWFRLIWLFTRGHQALRAGSLEPEVRLPDSADRRARPPRRRNGQVQFADQLAVKQASVSRWESGSTEPSVENYIRMGNLADEADCIWFWERAGVDMKRIELDLCSKNAQQETPKDDIEAAAPAQVR